MAGLYAVNMSTAVLSVRLPEELKRRLDDLEYAYALKAEAEAVRRGEIKTRRLDEITAALGLDA